MAIVLGFLNPLAEAWLIWASGASMTNVDLWGYSMRWWGRVGKACLFLSGLAVALDLVDPNHLRERGRRAASRVSSAKERALAERARLEQLNRLSGLQSSMIFSILRDDPPPSEYSGIGFEVPSVIKYYRVRDAAHRAEWIARLVAREPLVGSADLAATHDAAIEQLHESCADPEKRLCRTCERTVIKTVNAAFDALLTPGEKDLLQLPDGLDKAENLTLMGIAFCTLAIVALGVVPAIMLGLAWSPIIASLLAIALGPLFIELLEVPHRVGAAAESVKAAPSILLLTPIAAVLDKARPGHLFRWIAFVLFIVGSHFELLSS